MDERTIITALIDNIEKVIVGKRQAIELCLAALFSRGHVLVEDVPGLGKTMLARAIATSISAQFKRIQFTPDLLPSDITGISVYNQQAQAFEPRPGPIFSNIILADEINRTTPRTQSGLLEAMQEARVTIDGTSYDLPKPFFVIATENPMEFQGTYPLPEAQLDRFLLRISVGYPAADEEEAILKRQFQRHPIETLGPVTGIEQVQQIQEKVTAIYLSDAILRFITSLVRATRTHPDILLGSSPRGSLALMQASRAYALICGRDFVTPDDVKLLAPCVLGHRCTIKTEAQVESRTVGTVIEEVLRNVPVPL